MNERESGRPERRNSSDRGGFGRGSRPDRPSRGDAAGARGRFSSEKPRQDRPGRGGEDRDRERPEWQTRVERPRRDGDDRPKSPMIPEEITEKDLDLLVRVQFKTLSPENAERVARHLAMVNLLINDDPELAHKHALAAADRAGRIGVVRETLGVTAYTVGDYALALRELQAFRRISGSNDQLPIMVDSERGMGRPDKALELGRSVAREKLAPGVRANLAIAMSGARLDKNQPELALAELEIPELNPSKVFDYSPQLFRAYADTLEVLGKAADARKWWDLAARAERAISDKARGDDDIVQVVEEIQIPEPYAPRAERPARESRGTARYGERDSRDSGRSREGYRANGRDARGADQSRNEGRQGERKSSGFRPDGGHPEGAKPTNDGVRPEWKKRRDS